MIGKMHERTNGPVFKIIFALVSLSFVITGIGTGLSGTDTSAVKVNGTSVEQRTFNDTKARQQNLMYEQMGEQVWNLLDNPEYMKQFNLSVLNGLINDELLRQYTDTLKLGVSAEQIKAEIVRSPNFQQDGKFDNALYQQALRNNGLTPDGYEAVVAEGMLLSQVQEGLIESEFSVPSQQALLAKLLLQKRHIRVATASLAEQQQKETASEEELKAYYDAHKSTFIAPEQMAVEYVLLTPKDVENRVQITDEQINTYYEKNKEEFVSKGETQLAHIQLASESEAKAVESALQQGADFAKTAQEKSVDKLSATKGGDLGWAKAGTFPAAFEEAAAKLQVGQISQPIKVGNGYHIVKVLDRKAEKGLTLADAKAQIAQTLRQELTLTEFSNVAREMANKSFENNGSLEEVAKFAQLPLQKTAMFTQQNVPDVLKNEKVMKALFGSELRQTGQNSEALEIGDADNPKTLFVRVSNYQAEQVKAFDAAKSEVEQAVKRQKAEKALLTKAQDDVKALSAGQNVGLTFGQPQTLVYAQSQGKNAGLSQAVFSMAKPTNQASYQVARDENGNVLVVALDKVEEGTEEEFKPLAGQFEQANKLILRQQLLQDLRSRASIKENSDFIESLDSTQN